MPPTPTPQLPTEPERPAPWPRRAIHAIRDRQLPYRVQRAVDPILSRFGFHERTVRANGYRVRVRRNTSDELFVQTQLVRHEYTPTGDEIQPTDTVIDIGGNIGTFALHAARCAHRGHVFTFEPDRENCRLLERNLALNRCRNVTAERVAVAGSDGTVTLYRQRHGGYHSTQADRATADRESVPAISLATIFRRHAIDRCDFLKLDCEGAEYEILYAAPDVLRRVSRIAMEFHGGSDAAVRRRQSDELANYLERQGFTLNAYEDHLGFRCGFIRAARL